MSQTVRGVVALSKGAAVSIEQITVPDPGRTATTHQGGEAGRDYA